MNVWIDRISKYERLLRDLRIGARTGASITKVRAVGDMLRFDLITAAYPGESTRAALRDQVDAILDAHNRISNSPKVRNLRRI